MQGMRRYLKWLPNAITLSRGLFSVASFLAVLHTHWVLGFWLLITALATDFLDGLAARKLHVTSTFGADLDAFIDSLVVVLGVLSLSITGHLSWWITIADFAVAAAIGSDRVFDQPVWKWRATVAVVALFIAWVGIVWLYASLAFGWSWLYLPVTLLVLVSCALLKRKRVRVWIDGSNAPRKIISS